VNYLNWCGRPDGLSRAISDMDSAQQERVVVAWQMQASDGDGAAGELDAALEELGRGWVDVVTFYYVESEAEWASIASRGGALDAMQKAQSEGKVRLIGLTSHQRRLAASIARGDLGPADSGGRPLDMLMLRYNAAHRGAEKEVFPSTNPLGLPVVVYTCLRWGALMEPTAEDPDGFQPPEAREWYRFALAHPSVAVAIAAPDGREELNHDLSLLDDWRAPSEAEYEELRSHGDRVYRNAGGFP
jgi:aryl-alcohol dehydrogenase-like predicted oxidoreductase